MAQKLPEQLKDAGSRLAGELPGKDGLIKLLKQAASSLSELAQSPPPAMLEGMQPCLNAIVRPELLKHTDRDIEVLVATCICEITRITAPEAPYSDEVLRDIFHLFVCTFSGLNDINSPSFGRRVVILETLARYRSCVMMLDLECTDLINKMFKTFLSVVSDDHPEGVVMSMQTNMILILDESEDVPENLLLTLLSALGRKSSDVSIAARRLAMKVIEICAGKLENGIKQFLLSSISGDTVASSDAPDYHEVIFDIYQCAPQILFGVIPYITGELLTDQLDVRLNAVKLLGDMFSLPGVSISEYFLPLFSEFLKRLTDRVVEVRISVVEHVRNCLISNPFRPEAPEIICALCDRLLDYDENVRKEVVAALFGVANHSLKSIPSATVRLISERLRDKSFSIRRYTMERLAELYRLYCAKSSDDSLNADDFEWIPGKILRCLYDKDFRPETIEDILSRSLFPSEFPMKDKLEHWVSIFSGLDKVEVKALEQVLLQKQRLQQELQKYLDLRQTCQQDGNTPDLQKKVSGFFRTMSRLFGDPAKAEDSFHNLNQLKDVNIWKILIRLLDPCTSLSDSLKSRDELLNILGDKHPLYDFMGTLSIRCSYLLFNKEFVGVILLEAARQQPDGNKKLLPCMNLLAVLACSSPSLLSGFEEDLVHLLKEDNEIAKEGIAHVLAKAGGIIRHQLAITSNSVDLLLERLCLEGSRKQAKYSVQALAAITKDDGLKALSVLYKKLVDLLEKETHLPAVLQSLGCIAQNAMPIFETKESDIINFIMKKLLARSNKDNISKEKLHWNARSELCCLKIYSLKTLVKSYLPLKDAHLRTGIENVLETLRSILRFGEISENIESSDVDKAHLRLAAAKAVLRLSKHWDHKIPIDIFHLTLRILQDRFQQARNLFSSKVHQYIKERFLDAKYACAFVYNITEVYPADIKEDKQNLVEVIQIHHQLKARQFSVQNDTHPVLAYPEYILAYLIHALAHHPSFPCFSDRADFQPFEPVYRRLHLFLSALLNGDEGCQQANSSRTKESFSIVTSILQSIKHSEDIVDETKTKNSWAICDLGHFIANRLIKDHGDIKEPSLSVPLPPLLYKPIENNDGDTSLANDERSWLGAKAVEYFESLELENKADSTVDKDEKVSLDSDPDGNEIPLGKIMETIKLQCAKKKKLKKRTSQSAKRKSDLDVDVLGVVREINLGKQPADLVLPIHNVGKGDKDSTSDIMSLQDNDKKSVASLTKNKNKNMGLSLSTPKRKRSPFTPKNASKSERKYGKIPFLFDEISAEPEPQNSMDEELKSTDSDFLSSHLPAFKTSPGSQKKAKYVNGSLHVGKPKNDKRSSLGPVQADTKNDSSISPTAHARKEKQKQKQRNFPQLAKCSKKLQKQETELVGCKIKVWWPLDKQFYQGKIQSYDPIKKKHVIFYDDGEVEVLCLEKEKWELVNTKTTPRKKPKTEEISSSQDHSPKKHDKSADNRKRKRSNSRASSSSKRARKTTRQGKNDRSRISEKKNDIESSDAFSVDNSNVSDGETRATSEIDDVHSDGKRPNDVAINEPENAVSEENQPAFSRSGDSSESEKETEEGQEEAAEEAEHDMSSSSSDKNSDDEPLNTWRQRAGK